MSRNNIQLSYGNDLLMPGNSVIIKNFTNSLDEQNRRLHLAEQNIQTIIDDLKKRRQMLKKSTMTFKNQFTVDSSCTGCGLCSKVCSFHNITMISNKPSWQDKCQACLSCFHYCPQKSININDYTKSRTRYHHPAISAKDIME